MKAVSHGVIPTCGFSLVYNRYKTKIVRLYLTAEPERDRAAARPADSVLAENKIDKQHVRLVDFWCG